MFGDNYLNNVAENSHWWGIFDHGLLVAFASASPERHVLKLSSAGVLPGYRGHGMQTRLIKSRIRWAKRKGFHRVKTYTESENTHSTKNLAAAGFTQRVRGTQIDHLLELR